MVALSRHNKRDRLLVAELQGTARWAVNHHIARDEAVAALHELTDDPHLLGHAWAHPDRLGMPTPWLDDVNAILGGPAPEPAG